MKTLVLFLVLGLVAIAGFAFADVALGTALTSTAVIDHGDWQRLPDAGFSYTVCGYALRADGAKIYTFPTAGGEPIGPCENCQPGTWASAPATCSAQWKTNRGL